MFAQIKTNGAHTIVIAIPHEGADKTLPALASMFENNAIFINSPSWQENGIVKPEITIHLNSVPFQSRNDEFIVQFKDPSAVISGDWVSATPEILVSNHKAVEKLEKQLQEKDSQIQLLRLQLNEANLKLQNMQEAEED